MNTFHLKCTNNSGNNISFAIYQKFKTCPNSITPPISLLWAAKNCNTRTTAFFSWTESPLFVFGKWPKNQNRAYDCTTAFSPSSDCNAVILEKDSCGYHFEKLSAWQGRSTLLIEDSRELIRRELFVGLGMNQTISSSEQYTAASIVFEAQKNLRHEFSPLVDYYLTYGSALIPSFPLTEFLEQHSLKLRFPIDHMHAVLRPDNTLVLRRDDPDD